MSYQQEKFKEIADKIRELTDTTDPIIPSNFAAKIDDVWENAYQSGYGAGENMGHSVGYQTGLAEGETNGRQAQYDEFWDVYQNNGEGINPQYAFAYIRWNDNNYNPKYPIRFRDVNLTNVFYTSFITDTKVPIHVEGCVLNNSFKSSKIVVIRELIVDENTSMSGASFPASLVSIKITGTLGTSTTFANCSALDADSVDSIVDALKELQEGDEARTLTLHPTVKENMTDSQKAIIQEKGWTLA